MRQNIYRALGDGYKGLRNYEKLLDISLQAVEHPKIRPNYVDEQNLGRAYILTKKYKEAILYLEKARQKVLKVAPTNYRRQRNIYRLLKTAYYRCV